MAPVRLLAPAAAALLAACSSGAQPDTPAAPAAPAAVASIEVLPRHNRLVLLSTGRRRTRPLRAVLRDARGKRLYGLPVAWSSEAASVQVDSSGTVSSSAPGGPVRVTARSGGVSGTATICAVLYQNDFDDADPGPVSRAALDDAWNAPWGVTGLERTALVAADDDPGARWLRVSYPRGSVGPGQGGAVWVMALGGSYRELYASYSVRFGPGFDFVEGGKLPGLAGGAGNTGGVRPNGRDGWSARGMWTAGGRLIQYVYHPDQATDFGDDFSWTYGLQPVKVVPGRWYHVEHHVVMNTPGQHDGLVQAWIDGVLVLNRGGVRFRDVDAFAIDQFQFSTFFGGSLPRYAARNDEVVDFDDFVISTFRVGPRGAPATPECQQDAG